MVGKKTWTPEEEKCGYSTRKAPEYVSAVSTPEHKGGAKQNVKGKMGSKAPAESRPASGRKQ